MKTSHKLSTFVAAFIAPAIVSSILFCPFLSTHADRQQGVDCLFVCVSLYGYGFLHQG